MTDPNTDLTIASSAPMSARAIRLGIIGCSLGRSRYHIALQACPSIRIAGIADSDERHTRIWARDIGNRVPAYANIPALLDATDTFDALLIASSLGEREQNLLSALPLGKPILAEVPFTTRSDVAYLATPSSLLMPALPRRLDPWFKAAEAQIQANAIGTVQQVRCHWSFPIESVDETEDIITGGWNGLIQTLGCQTADLSRQWLGDALTVSGDIDVEELRGVAGNRAHRRPADRSLANMIVTHQQGQTTHHLSRTRSVKADERYLFIGTTGNLELIVSAGATAAATSVPALNLQRPGQRAQRLPVSIPVPMVGKIPLTASSARILTLLEHFTDCIQQNSPSPLTAQDAHAALEIVQAAYLSTEERVKVSLPLRRFPNMARLLTPHNIESPGRPALPPGK